ncbi:hypothetical protein [Algiphilus sp.]|uniref:hypothetical protein n=1 Tax=Algiphilus sp. TaxID=1872431 RepID=UPI0025BD902B|nr:hypothetical protein [Algiphilus sp.]MCK5770835.1 hypothetical protein [Algiphilus sp.]
MRAQHQGVCFSGTAGRPERVCNAAPGGFALTRHLFLALALLIIGSSDAFAMLAYTCTEGDEGTTTVNLGRTVPTCSSGGAWVDIYAPGTAAAELDPTVAAAAFGAGFVLIATGMVIVTAGRMIVDAIRRA